MKKFYIVFNYVDKQGYIESDFIAQCEYVTVTDIEKELQRYTELHSLRQFKVCSRNLKTFILQTPLLNNSYYVELTFFSMNYFYAELLEEYVNSNSDRQFIDTVVFKYVCDEKDGPDVS